MGATVTEMVLRSGRVILPISETFGSSGTVILSSSLISGLSSVKVDGLALSVSEISDSDAVLALVLSSAFFPQAAANTAIAIIAATAKIFLFLIILLTLFFFEKGERKILYFPLVSSPALIFSRSKTALYLLKAKNAL